MCGHGLGAVATGATVLGGLTKAYGQSKENDATEAALNFQAGVSDINATLAIERGRVAADKVENKTKQTLGRQTAGYAANGIVLGEGSPLDVMGDTAAFGEMDRLNTLRNAKSESDNFKNAATVARAKAQNIRDYGWLTPASTLLSSGGQVASHWYKAS